MNLITSLLILGSYYNGGSRTDYEPQFSVRDLSLLPGLDEMCRAEMDYGVGYWGRSLSPDLDHCHLNWGILPTYSHAYSMPQINAGSGSSGILHLRSYQSGVGTWLNAKQDYLVDNGVYMEIVNYDPTAPDATSEYVYFSGLIWRTTIFYFNPIVNSLDRLWAPSAGGVAVVLTGLGFDNLDSELETGGPARGGSGWQDRVDKIHFEGLQGQGTTSLSCTAGDFTVDSNTQITIPANKFPALAAGTYHIKLEKENVNLDANTDITGYAGDWNCDSDGRCYTSTRITFYVSDVYVDREFRERKAPLVLSDWHLRDRSDGSEVMKYYAMDYIRATDRVYKGNLSAISSIPRGFEGKTGLFKISDLTLDLANNDLEFSKLLAGNTILKNQIVKVYQAYPDEPFGWRSHIISLIIDDYSLEDEIFKVKLKDITQKYFRADVPRNVCSSDYGDVDYSNIHPDNNGAPVPEVVGLCSLTTGEFRGQVEAICIDTANYKYLAANGVLYSIDEVYSDDVVAVSTSNYSVSVEEGRTYITFTSDQEDKKVTFNCKGVSYSGLNSDNGYVQNPAYITLYFLLEILSVSPDLIDFASFDDLATVYDNMGEGEAGKLILQDKADPMDVLQDLLAGSKIFTKKDGRLTVGKKDMSNFSTNNGNPAPIIFRQLEAVGKAFRKYNLRDAISAISAEFDYCPTWDLFKSNAYQGADIVIDPWEITPLEDTRTTPRAGGGRRGTRKRRPWAR